MGKKNGQTAYESSAASTSTLSAKISSTSQEADQTSSALVNKQSCDKKKLDDDYIYDKYEDYGFDQDDEYVYSLYLDYPDFERNDAAHRGLNEASINLIPSGKYESEAGRNMQCEICLINLEIGEDVRHFSCDHFFHLSCADQCLKNSATCPKCRRDMMPRQ